MMNRSSGVLLPISSLPSPYGIGTFGKEAYDFIDFLYDAGQSYWQILPLGITSYGDSPYQSPSAFAGNHYFIDLDLLVSEGYLDREDLSHLNEENTSESIDYYAIFQTRIPLLRIAYERRYESIQHEVSNFLDTEKDWLEEFALFMAIKSEHELVSWQEWPEAYRNREPETINEFLNAHREEITFWYFVQYLFFQQWSRLKAYAHERNIKIIGDLPIYVALDSVDVWANPELFYLDSRKVPVTVSGCPPDCFAITGQLWGNPIYDWEAMKQQGYQWWIKRMAMSARIYDVIRIDHFRGFEAYYEIPYSHPTAEFGEWISGPGLELFDAIEAALGKLPIIAEDLGFMTPEFYAFHEATGYPGMKVMQFAFDERDTDGPLPYSFEKNSVVYTSTHDNNTILGWLATEASEEAFALAKEYLLLSEEEGYSFGFIRGAWSTSSKLAIAPMQDLLGLGSNARINTPSTLGNNWKWRMKSIDIDKSLSSRLLRLTKLYGRFCAR